MSVTIKSLREIELMREAGKLLGKAHDELGKAIRPGMSTKEVDRIGDLFGAYSGYGGNHGVGAVYSQYKKLKIKGE